MRYSVRSYEQRGWWSWLGGTQFRRASGGLFYVLLIALGGYLCISGSLIFETRPTANACFVHEISCAKEGGGGMRDSW